MDDFPNPPVLIRRYHEPVTLNQAIFFYQKYILDIGRYKYNEKQINAVKDILNQLYNDWNTIENRIVWDTEMKLFFDKLN